jgi:hypothetical protein
VVRLAEDAGGAVFAVFRRGQQDALVPVPGGQRGWRRVVGQLYAFGAYALGSAASSVGSTITIAGYVIAGVLTVATIVVARLSLRSLEQRAEVAFPDEQAGSVAQPQPVGN